MRARSARAQRVLLPIAVLLLPLLPGPARAAQAPVIDALAAERAAVAPGDVVRISVAAHDPDCAGECTSGCGLTIRPDLTVWTPAAGSVVARDDGVQASPYQAWIDWQAPPEEGVVALTVSLSDSGTFMCGGRKTTTAELSLNVSTSTNQPPVVASVTAEPVRLFPGESSLLTCTASDPDDGDALSFAWTADQGTIAPTGPGTALFTGDRPGTVAVTCSVTDLAGAVASGSVGVVLSDAMAESALSEGLGSPGRIAVDSLGDVYVADAATGGLAVLNLASGGLVYHLPLAGAECVAVDWLDRLLVGGPGGARVVERSGGSLLELEPGESLGAVVAVAADRVRQRYVVLHGAGRVVVYDATGAVVSSLGSAGDGPDQLKAPRGVAVTPEGHVVVADSGHARIKVFAVDGSLLGSFGGSGGGAGQFVQLEDVAVDARGVIYASDTYQSWVQTFDPDGSLREVLGTYGGGVGEFQTPTGVASADALRRLVVASANSSSIHVFRLEGAPPVQRLPHPVLTESRLDFAAQAVGTTSAPKTVTLTNEGDAPLGIRDVSLVGRFQQVDDCPAFVDPGQACSFAVRYLPEVPGSDVGALTVETSAASSLQVVRLTGEAIVRADLAVAPGRIDFADQAVGSTSAPERLTLTNTGTVPMRLFGTAVEGPYSVAGDCTGSLAGGASCGLDVYFTPDTAGDSLPGAVRIESDAASGLQSVPLDGRGVVLDLTSAPASVDFGFQEAGSASRSREVVLTNVGEDFLIIERVALEGARPDAFATVRDACGGSRLEPGETCGIDARFEPPEPELRYAAELRVWSRAAGSPEVVALAGSTVGLGQPRFADDFESADLSSWTMTSGPPTVELALGSGGGETAGMEFPPSPVGASASAMGLVVLNTGEEPLRVGAVALWDDGRGAFSIELDACSQLLLEPGARCEVQLGFAPSKPGRARGQLAVPHDGGVATVSLLGHGQPAAGSKGR